MNLHRKRQFVFFDVGQTLVNEWDFIDYFDKRFLELLNGFGARIDVRNYQAVRDNVIRDRKIGYGYIREIIIEVCKLISQTGYDKIIANKLEHELDRGRNLFRFFDDAEQTMEVLSKQNDLGMISNQSGVAILHLLKYSNINRFFKVIIIPSEVQMKKPDPEILLQLAIDHAECQSEDCIMVGDRLDTDIGPANKLGMKTIRITNSLFKLQRPTNEFEQPMYTVANLGDIPNLLLKIRHSSKY
jgi:HAD superfamily hydrolase (TIGR01549 family)